MSNLFLELAGRTNAIVRQMVASLFLFILITFFTARLSAQSSITNYNFAGSSSTFTALSSPVNPALTGDADDGYFNGIPIGFDFWYMGTRYTTVSASTNGWLTLGANISNSTFANSLTSGGTPRPVIAPLWDDLDLQNATNLSYKTTGSAPNRVCTIQYLNAQWDYQATGNTMSFQVKLYEGTGKTEFVYRQETGALNNASGSIGIAATATGSGNYLSVKNNGSSASSTTESNITSKPVSNNKYAFTPPIPAAPASLIFTAITNTSITLNWSDLSANERGFVIYQSTDGVTYTFAAQTAANVTTSVHTGLTAATLYYWKIYSVTEGGLCATALSGSQSTACTPPGAPVVTSPVDYCQNATAIQLTATGSNLLWGNVAGSVGGTSGLTTATYVDNSFNNKKTNFTTTTANVIINTVDYYIPAYQSVTGVVLSIYNSGGTVIATSSTTTTLSAGAAPVRISNTFNYTLASAGDYSIGISAGTGNLGADAPAFPITEVNGAVNITGVSSAGNRCFNNIQFIIEASSVAPTPVTSSTGAFQYMVSQTIGGCVSPQATITVNVTAPNTSQIPAGSLVANYPFNSNANDVSGNNNTGTLQNSPTQTTDRFGVANTAYSLNGSSQFVSTTNAFTNPGNFTVSIWFKTSTTTGGKLIGFGSSRTGASSQYDRHIYMNNAGQLYFGVYPGVATTVNTALSYNDNNWHLATATLSGTAGMSLYVDGALAGFNAAVTTAENFTGYWRIGYDNVNGWTSQPTSYYFNGTLDDALIYTRALSALEVATLYGSPDGAGNNGPACIGSTLSLNATTLSGATYAWTGPGGFTSSSQNPSFTYTAAKAGTYTVQVTAAGCTATAYTNVTSTSNAGQWTGSVSTNWATGDNWCTGVVPSASTNVLIPAGAINMPSISSSVVCNNLTVNSGATLTITGTGTLNIAGTLTNNGTLANTGTVNFNGTSGQQTFSGVSSFYNVTLTNAGGLLLPNAIAVANNLTLTTGILNANNFNLTVGGNWVNNVSTAAFTAGNGTVTLNGAAAQSIGGSFSTSFNHLNISNTGNTVSLAINTAIAGDLNITSGTFDLGSFTANRTTSGGILTVANNATLKIGGANTYPSNYTTNTLVVASTVEYYGTNQTVSNQVYGNLTFSSASGAATKTMPGTALTVVGNLTSNLGSGTSVSFTAASNISVSGVITIGASTTFNGGSYAHTCGGNWINNGTFTGSTSTVTFTGPGSNVGGSGAQNFNNLTVFASQVTFANATINLSGNLATTSSGSFTQAAGGTLGMSGSGKTISGSGISLENFTISGTVSSTTSFSINGDLSVSGSLTTSAGNITMTGTSKTISGAGTKSLAALTVTGTVTTDASFSIGSNLTVQGSLTASAGTATFTGSSVLSGTANLFNTTINGTSLKLSANAVLGIASSLTLTAGTLDVSSTAPNTVQFNGAGAQSINALTYDNLILSNGNTKTAAGSFTVNQHITIAGGTTFVPGAYTHHIYKNWNNNGTFTAGSSTIEFLGDQTSQINGATTFNVITVNNSTAATSLVLLNDVSAATVNMTMGTILTGNQTLTITNTRTGNGIILGNIRRTHTFTTGVAYAFEGPDNTITFSAVSSVTSITVSVVKSPIGDFPYGASISREYAILVPAGTYTATLRLHYEDVELNGNVESSLLLWNYNGSLWLPEGKSGNSTTSNYVEQSGLTDITDRWTCGYAPDVVEWNGSVSTDWNTAANWTSLLGSGSTPPAASDVVALGTAAFTHQPIISTSITVKNIVFGSVQDVTLTLASGGTLVSGDMLGIWSGNANHTLNAGNQSITVNGDLSLSDGTSNHTIDLNVGSGSVSVNGTLHQSGGADIVFSGAGDLSISQDFDYVSGTFTAGTGTVTYNGVDNQNVGAVNYHHLAVDKSGAEAFINDTITISGDLLVLAGELDNLSLTNVAGNVDISSGAILENLGLMHVGGNWTNDGAFEAFGAGMIFDGSGTQTISASTFNNLNIDKPVGSTAILSGNIAIKGDLNITSGTFDIQTYDCNRVVQGGNITIGDSATFIVGANNSPMNFAGGALATSSTVIANGTDTQYIFGAEFGNLVFRNAGQKILVSPITVKGNLAIETGATFSAGTQTLTLEGNWINNGTFSHTHSTIVCTGTAKTISGNNTFHRFSVYGSYTLLNNNTFDSLLVINVGGSLSGDASISTTMNGDLVNKGILYTLGSTTFTGAIVQTLSLINAVQTVAVTVNFNGSVSPVLNSSSAPQFGYLNINNTGGIYPSVGWTVLYGLTIGSGASFIGGSSTHHFLGSVTNNGTFTSDGVLHFLPASTATVNLGSSFTSTGLVNFGGAGALTLAGSGMSFYDVVISNTNGSGITATSGLSISNNFTVNSGSLLQAGTYTHSVGGNFTNNGTINSGTSTFLLNGSAHQDVQTASALYHLTVNKSGGLVSLFSDITVNGALNFIAGNIETGSNALIQPSSGTVTGAGQSTGWIDGNLQKNIPSGASTRSFEVGDATNYSPVSLTFSAVATSGNLTVSVAGVEHPQISNSVINATKSVNRYWTLTPDGLAGVSYDAVFHFVSGDIDSGADTAAFGVGRYNGSAWMPSTVVLPLATSITTTGQTKFGDFAIGEVCNANTNIAYAGSPVCSSGSTSAVTLTGTTGGTFASRPGLTVDDATGLVDISVSTPGTYLVSYTLNASGGCPVFVTATSFEITPEPSATVYYPNTPYCSSSKAASITLIGTSGGDFSSTTGLTIDPDNGVVNLITSTAGNYTVTYDIAAAGGCSAFSTTADITVTMQPFATGTYEGNPYCSNGGIAFPTGYAEGMAGTLGSTAGLVIDSLTGVIDLAASTPDIYTVTYTVPAYGGCALYTNTATVAITDAPFATFSYTGSPYCGNAGTATATFSGTTGGTFSGTSGLSIDPESGDIDPETSGGGTYTVSYTVAAADGCAEYTATTSITIVSLGTWTGDVDNDWNTADNWICQTVPGAATSVTIPDSLINYPAITSGTSAALNLTIEAGASLLVSDATLQIGGAISNAGIFDADNGAIELNGAVAQTIPAATFMGNTLKSLTVHNSGGVTLAGALSLTDVLTITDGSLSTGGFLTLKSTATGTARVAQITSGAGIPVSGNVLVERYIPGRRRYRLITSSATTSTSSTLTNGEEAQSIWGNWQNQGDNVTGNVGTIITGGSSNDGFDTPTGNASLFTYNDVNRVYVPYSSANGKNTKYTPLKAGVAYFMFVYGDRLNTVSTSTPNNTVLKEYGTLLTGDQEYNTVSGIPLTGVTGRYTMLGNPFASPINWATIPRTDLENTYWGWDPNLSNTGGYITVTTLGAVTISAPYSGSTGLNQYIQPGQGFFVKTSGASPALSIREQDKVANFNGSAFRFPNTLSEVALMAVNMHYMNGAEKVLTDGVLAVFDTSFSSQLGVEDAAKLSNFAENIAILQGNTALSIDGRPVPQSNDTMFLNLTKITKPEYILQIFAQNLGANGMEAYLQDNYLNTVQALSLTDTNNIVFQTNQSIPGSIATNRFRILFHPTNTVPVTSVASPGKPDIRLFPNPVTDHQVQLQIHPALPGDYTITLTNTQGQQIMTFTVNHPGGNFNRTLALDKDLDAGLYFLHIGNSTGNYVQSLFIK